MFLDFISQNWIGALIGLCGIIIGIIGVFVSYVFFRKSLSKAVPGYFYDSNTVIEINEKTKTDHITLFYKEKEIPRLTKTRVVFWNAGNKTIDGHDIIDKEKLRIEFPKEGGSVLSAQVVKRTRDVNRFIVIHETANNIIFLDFDYLDKNDGVVIEILHTFSTNLFHIQGIIKGIPEGIKDYGVLIEPYMFEAFTRKFSPILGKGIIFRIFYSVMLSKIFFMLILIFAIFYLYAAYDPSLIPEWPVETMNFGTRLLNFTFGIFLAATSYILYMIRNRKKIPKSLILRKYE